MITGLRKSDHAERTTHCRTTNLAVRVHVISFIQRVVRELVFFSICCTLPLNAATVLAGFEKEKYGYTAEASPYIIEKDIIIPQGDSIVLGEGCQFFFKPFTGIIVHGSLIVRGTSEHPVIFSSINDTLSPEHSSELPNPFDWNGIYISPRAGLIELSDFILKYSVYGIKSQKESFISINICNEMECDIGERFTW